MQPQKELCFGLVGAGTIAEFHLKAIREISGARVKGVFTPSPSANRFAEQHGITAYPTLEAMLADQEINAVTIATPSGLHGDPAVAAARAGKHVLCEKPLEVTPKKAKAIVDACAENRVILAPVFQMRYGSGAQLIRKALDQGRFGKVLLVSAKIKWLRTQAYYDSADWRGGWEVDGGGCTMNQAIHAIDLMTWFGGVPGEVYGYYATQTHDIAVEDNAVAVVRFKNGVMGSIEASTSCAPGFPLEVSVSGDKGTATLSADTISSWCFVDEHPLDAEVSGLKSTLGSGGSDPKAISITGHVALVQDMLDALNGRPHHLISGLEACYPVDIIYGLYQAARTGKPVALPYFDQA